MANEKSKLTTRETSTAMNRMLETAQKNIIRVLISLARSTYKDDILEFSNGVITKGNPIGLIPEDANTFTISIKKLKELHTYELVDLGLTCKYTDTEFVGTVAWTFHIEKQFYSLWGKKFKESIYNKEVQEQLITIYINKTKVEIKQNDYQEASERLKSHREKIYKKADKIFNKIESKNTENNK